MCFNLTCSFMIIRSQLWSCVKVNTQVIAFRAISNSSEIVSSHRESSFNGFHPNSRLLSPLVWELQGYQQTTYRKDQLDLLRANSRLCHIFITIEKRLTRLRQRNTLWFNSEFASLVADFGNSFCYIQPTLSPVISKVKSFSS